MKQALCRVLSAAAVAAWAVAAQAAQVYSVAVYAGGISYLEICSLSFPFPPQHYTLTERSWREDARGFNIMDIGHKTTSGDTLRQYLDVECGSNSFSLPLDSVLAMRASGKGSSPAGMNGSGDLARLVIQCAVSRGGHTPTNTSPVIQASWLRRSQGMLDIILVDGDHFSEVESFLQHSYGAPDTALRSSAPVCNGRSLTYTPQQIGAVLTLTGASGLTVVSVMGRNKP
jgi:hypothetical protein